MVDPPCARSAIGTAAESVAIGATLIQVEPFDHRINAAPVGGSVEAIHAGVVQLGIGHGLCHFLPAGEVGGGGVAVHGGVVN